MPLVKRLLHTISVLFRKTEIKIAIFAVMVLSLVPFHFGRYDRVSGAVADAGHFWFYFLVFFYLRNIVSRPRLLVLGLVAVSGIIEIIQPYVDRDGNIQDFAVSSLGAICGYLFSLQYPLTLRTIVVAICSVPLFFPIYWQIDALRYQEKLFPELADFSQDQWSSIWEPTAPEDGPSSTMYIAPNGELVVRALSGKEWPGIIYFNQFLSWIGYDALEIEVESFGDSLISIRVDDEQKCTEFNDRFNKSYPLKHGINKINIPFDELRMTRSGRMMNIEKIKRVALFTSVRDRPEKVFAIRAMRLVK